MAGIALVGFIASFINFIHLKMAWHLIIVRALDLITIVVPPALPATLTIGTNFALSRLKGKHIFCISPQRVTVGGKLDIMCFDKTGTLTEDGLDVLGVRVVSEDTGAFGDVLKDSMSFGHMTASETHPSLLQAAMYTMATCHSLRSVDEALVGDPLDFKMFEFTNWSFEEGTQCTGDGEDDESGLAPSTARPPDGQLELGVLKSFEFVSQLRRASVVVRQFGKKSGDIFVKGAPEAMREICAPESLPVDYEELLSHYTHKGYRVIGCATRHLKKLSWIKVQKMTREEMLVLGGVFARMSPDEKHELVEKLQSIDYSCGFCGDGANDCGALKAADVGISLSEAEASVAAPFTSRVFDIRCVLEVIKEGRAALVTSFSCFKYMSLYSAIQFTSVSFLYAKASNLGDFQFLFIDLLLILPIAIFMGWAGPARILHTKRPISGLVSRKVLTPLLGLMVICIGVQAMAYIAVREQPWYIPPEVGHDESDIKNSENTALFLTSCFEYIFSGVILNAGPPFRESTTRNWPFIATILLSLAMTLLMIAGPFKWLQKLMELTRMSWDYKLFFEGIYHGRIVLPPTYPLRPPMFRFNTPNGRFEANREICLSISGHHEETWQPAWGVRTALVALRSFMETEARGQLGGLETTNDVRKRLANESGAWTCNICARSNAEIMKDYEKCCSDSDINGSDDPVPQELRLTWKDEMKPEDASGENKATEHISEDPELAEGLLCRRLDIILPRRNLTEQQATKPPRMQRHSNYRDHTLHQLITRLPTKQFHFG
ncbi:hypothetical protein V2A60_004614 [Cordyceps javanica]